MDEKDDRMMKIKEEKLMWGFGPRKWAASRVCLENINGFFPKTSRRQLH